MEFLLLLLLSIPIFVLFLSQVIMKQRRRRGVGLPPGPLELPIIGNLHNIIGPLPHRTLNRLASIYGPIMHLKLGEVSTVVVSSAEAAKEILNTHDIAFASRPHLLFVEIMSGNKDFVFAPYGDYWRLIRKICVQDLLSSKKVESFGPIRADEISSLVRTIASANGAPVDLQMLFASMNNSISMRAIVGDKCKEQDRLIHLIKEGARLASGFLLADMYPSSKFLGWVTMARPKIMNLRKRTDACLNSIIQQHLEKRERTGSMAPPTGTEDLLDVLLTIKAEGGFTPPLTDDMIRAIIYELFGAGTETSTTTLGWIMSELMNNPEAMRKAQEEVREVFKGQTQQQLSESGMNKLEYLDLVIKESFRLDTPTPLLVPHQSRTDCNVMGYHIPNNTTLIVNIGAIMRDKINWGEDADSFIPERFKESPREYNGTHFDFLPFGSGRRMCPGVSFAMALLRSSLAHLLYYFDWKLPAGSQLDMAEAFATTVARKSNLCLCATTRFPIPTS